MENFIVYMHTNMINDKKYIGITCQMGVRRWRDNGYGYKNSLHFYSAINKYGWENFDHKVLRENLTKEDAEKEEIELIRFNDTTNRGKGYNIANGGRALGMHSKETRKKMSESAKARGANYDKLEKMWAVNRNRQYTEEQRRHMSEARMGKIVTQAARANMSASHMGCKLTEEHKGKISASIKEAFKNPEVREKLRKAAKENINALAALSQYKLEHMKFNEPVILTSTGAVFENHVIAGKLLNIQSDKILKNCQNETHSAGKDKEGNPLIWVFLKAFQDGFDYRLNLQETYSKINSGKTKSKVICITTNEGFGKIKDAVKKYGFKSPSGISMACSGKRSYSGKLPDGTKLKWRYA